jgi:hypothetical protein
MLIMAAGHDGKPMDYEEWERWTRVGYEPGTRFRGQNGIRRRSHFLTQEPHLYGAWIGTTTPLAPARLIRYKEWGPITEWRFRRPPGLHVELNVALPSRADSNPTSGSARSHRRSLSLSRVPTEAPGRAGFPCRRLVGWPLWWRGH